MLNFIIEWGSFDILQSGASGITKRGNFYYKVREVYQKRTTLIVKWRLEALHKKADELKLSIEVFQ